MNGKCNTLSLDTGAVLQAVRRRAEAGMRLEGQMLLEQMRREVQRTTHGGAPGKPAWRDEMEKGIKLQQIRREANSIEMDYGYNPSGQNDTVRAMIVTEGSGSAVGNPRIHAGPLGRSVWDGDVSGRHPSAAKSEYDLPDAFNQTGNEWLQNAMIMMDGRYGSQLEAALATLPDSVFYENVRVSG